MGLLVYLPLLRPAICNHVLPRELTGLHDKIDRDRG